MVSLPEVNYVRKATLDRVVDGDSLRAMLSLGWDNYTKEHIRLARCDTPESNRRPEMVAGKWVTDHVRTWIGDTVDFILLSKEYRSDKYDRCVAECWFDGRNLSEWLLDKYFAWPTDDTGRIIGPRDINRLIGIPAEIRYEVTKEIQRQTRER